jgi:dTDP-4-dehydrorhamnose reductase
VRVLILGATGIIGQHMRASCPAGVSPIYTSRGGQSCAFAMDATDQDALEYWLWLYKPSVVVNLAGESNTDKVERNPAAYERVNVGVPAALARLSDILRFRLIQVSSQAVFSGKRPTYGLNAELDPINEYGKQKAAAETAVLAHERTMVVRPTFVLGIRPDPTIGRPNPVENMLNGQRAQVDDRFFSVSFAPDVAEVIWRAVTEPDHRRVVQAGVPVRVSRYMVATHLGLDVDAVSHEDFPGIAPRPFDTTYACGDHSMSYEEGIADCLQRWEAREAVTA